MDFQKNNQISTGNFLFSRNYSKKAALYYKNIEDDVYPDNIFKNKDRIAIYKRNKDNKIDFTDDFIGEDSEVPRTELEEEQKKIAIEEEENNYYSFGDDDDN